jgi:ATP-dependent Lon protease
MEQEKKVLLTKLFPLIAEEFGQYLIDKIAHQVKSDWESVYVEALYDNQKEFWRQERRNGKSPESLVDINHFKPLSLKFKDLLRDEFGKKTNRLPTYFDEIIEVRNQWAHLQEIDETDYRRAIENIRLIAESANCHQVLSFLSNKEEEALIDEHAEETTDTGISLNNVTVKSTPATEPEESKLVLDELDKKALEHFRGYVVKKDLVGIIKGGTNVPAFVLEYLLANTCSTEDEEKLKEGMENVKTILRNHYINPEESNLIQSKLREKGRYKIIDKISVELDPQRDRYWANISNSNIKKANISDDLVKSHEKLLLGGIWAIIEMEYDPMITVGNTVYPFLVKNIKPIQLSTFDNTKISEKRKEFSKDEWKKLLLRSAGYEPYSEGLDDRKLNLLLCRLIPLVESNFNMVELGPRSSGKSYIYKEITPYAILISGGQGSVAQLFVNNTTGRVGAVGLWDAICFDESTDKLFKDRDAIPLMKDYMESGSFSRAKGGEISGSASVILNGNINQPVETVLQTSHLFSPLSDEVNHDTAFLDRINLFLPGWEITKFSPANFTNHFGFSTDFFSEILKSQRKTTYYDALDKYFTLGSHLKQRDSKSVRRIISGFIKLLHPDGDYTKKDIREYLVIAMEMRRRVKEQLKRIGGMEFWDTNFSYIDKETQEEIFVGLQEEKGSSLIESNPLSPGVCYTATSDGDTNALVKIEVVALKGSGKMNVTGTSSQEVKENIKNTYNYLRANERSILNEQHSLSGYDINIQISNLMGAYISGGIGSAVYIAIISAIYKKNLKPGLAVLGNISIGGAVERAMNFADKVTLLSENGAKTVLVPIENINELTTIPQSILGKTDVPFYGNSQMLLQKAVLGE